MADRCPFLDGFHVDWREGGTAKGAAGKVWVGGLADRGGALGPVTSRIDIETSGMPTRAAVAMAIGARTAAVAIFPGPM